MGRCQYPAWQDSRAGLQNYTLSLMFYKRLCDQWEYEADEAIAEKEKEQGRKFTDAQKAIFRARGDHRFTIQEGSKWGDVLAASTNLGEKLTTAMRAVSTANEELKGVFTVDWNQPAPERQWQASDSERGGTCAYPAIR